MCILYTLYTHLSTRRFAFEAFLPTDKKERQAVLNELTEETRTMIIYEAPHRLVRTLELNACYETSDAVRIQTTLLGPEKGEKTKEKNVNIAVNLLE